MVDFALYRRRLEEYDFDMIAIAGGDFTLPDATGLLTAFGSKSADEKGNNNFRGVKSRAADHLIKLMSEAQTLDELRDASRALDRVIMWSHWQVPDLYASDEKSSYWNKFGMPAQRPRYFTIDTASRLRRPGRWRPGGSRTRPSAAKRLTTHAVLHPQAHRC